MLVAQSCPALCDPVDCSPPGSSVHEIVQARILEWVAISSSRGSSQPRDRTRVSCTAGRFFIDWAAREAHIGKAHCPYNISPSLSDLLHSAWQFLALSTLLQMASFCSFIWLSNIPLHICAASSLGFPGGLDGKESACNADSIPGSGRLPWRREWKPTLVFLPRESHEQRSLANYSP